jgi:outer membrane immunogenic protein
LFPAGFSTNVTPCTLAGSCVGGRVVGIPANQALISALGTGTNRRSGFTGGGQIGYNWQMQNWVLGLEGDFEYFDARSSLSGTGILTTGDPVTVTNSVKSSWLATIRPRFGYAWNRTLVYVTGGAAFSDLRYTQSIVTTLAAATGALAVSSTRVGWTVGAGFEYAVTNNWSIKAEYLYTQFGALSGTSALVANDGSGFSNIYNASSGEQRDHVVRAGLNYHFNGPVVARY